MGATVIAAASAETKLQVAKDAGADHLINYADGELKDKVKGITNGKGADVFTIQSAENFSINAWGASIGTVAFSLSAS